MRACMRATRWHPRPRHISAHGRTGNGSAPRGLGFSMSSALHVRRVQFRHQGDPAMSKWFTRSRQERITASVLLAFGALVAACDTNGIGPDTVAWVTTLVDTATPTLATARTFAVPDTVVELDG